MEKINLVKASDGRLYNLNAVRFFEFTRTSCYLWFDFNTNVEITDTSTVDRIHDLVKVLNS